MRSIKSTEKKTESAKHVPRGRFSRRRSTIVLYVGDSPHSAAHIEYKL